MEANLSIYNSDWGTGGYYYLQTPETGYPVTDEFWKMRTEEIPNNCKYSEEEAVQMVKDLLEKLQPGNNLTVKEINPTYNGSKMDELGNSLDSQIEEEKQRTDDITALKEYMQTDEYIEKTAREKLGMVKDNEILFKESQSK